MKKVKQLIFGLSIAISAIAMVSCGGLDCELVDELPNYEDIVVADGARGEFLFLVREFVFDSLEVGDEFIIDNDSTYQAWQDASSGCSNCIFPDIDFSERTLVGKYNTLDCDEYVLPLIEKVDNHYIHYTKVLDESQCDSNICENFTFAWVTIPKINANTTFEFVYGESDYICDC